MTKKSCENCPKNRQISSIFHEKKAGRAKLSHSHIGDKANCTLFSEAPLMCSSNEEQRAKHLLNEI